MGLPTIKLFNHNCAFAFLGCACFINQTQASAGYRPAGLVYQKPASPDSQEKPVNVSGGILSVRNAIRINVRGYRQLHKHAVNACMAV